MPIQSHVVFRCLMPRRARCESGWLPAVDERSCIGGAGPNMENRRIVVARLAESAPPEPPHARAQVLVLADDRVLRLLLRRRRLVRELDVDVVLHGRS